MKAWRMCEVHRYYPNPETPIALIETFYQKGNLIEIKKVGKEEANITHARILTDLGQQGWEPYAIERLDSANPNYEIVLIHYFKRWIKSNANRNFVTKPHTDL